MSPSDRWHMSLSTGEVNCPELHSKHMVEMIESNNAVPGMVWGSTRGRCTSELIIQAQSLSLVFILKHFALGF